MNSLNKAKLDSRIKALLSSVNDEVKLTYQKRTDGCWSCQLENGVATIGYSECRHPSASFAHELLHVDTQLKGYRCPRIYTSNIAAPEVFRNMMIALDNELQHHKFYQRFIDLGFKANQFYEDSDTTVEEHLSDVLKLKFSSFSEILPHYLSCIAPGGSLSSQSQEKLKAEFRCINDGNYLLQFDAIDEVILSWVSDASYDISPILRRILLTVRLENNLTWIGFTNECRPPDQGIFVDKEFNVEGQK